MTNEVLTIGDLVALSIPRADSWPSSCVPASCAIDGTPWEFYRVPYSKSFPLQYSEYLGVDELRGRLCFERLIFFS